MKFVKILLLSVFLLPAVCYADTIQGPDCSVTPALCNFQARSLAYLDLAGGSNSAEYQTPIPGASYDSNSVTGSFTIPSVPFVFTGTAAGSVTDNFSGIHTYLSATASLFCGPPPYGTCPYGDSASANEHGSIIDAFSTNSSLPDGSKLQIIYTLDATGNTGHDAGGYFDDGVATNFQLGSVMGASCTAGAFAFHLSGTFGTTCSASIPIESGELVAMILELDASADATDTAGKAFLDASNTAKITAVTLTDSQGNPLSGVTLYDASGYDYNHPSVTIGATPELSSLTLLASGALGLIPAMRRRHKKRV